MNTVLIDLVKLQALDDRLRHWDEVIGGGPARLAEARTALTGLEARLSALDQDRDGMRRRHRELEAGIKDLAEKKNKNADRQMTAKSNEEYQAMLREAEHFTREISLAEDEALDLLDRLERSEVEKNDLVAALAEELQIFTDKSAEIEKAVRESQALSRQARQNREQLAAALPPDQMARYASIAKGRAGLAVAPVSGGMCLACRLSVPPQIFNELRRNENILVCPNCNRLIYWREHPDFTDSDAESKPAGQ